jgi:DNA polymerase III sliding clamp (beta) subunit (PCNA family)
MGNEKVYVIFNTIHLEFLRDGLASVSTDKRMIAKYKDNTFSSSEDMEITIPKKASTILYGILEPKSDKKVVFTYTENNAMIQTERFCLTTSLYTYRYPDVNGLINLMSSVSTEVIADKNAMMQALKRMSPVISSSDLIEFSFERMKTSISGLDGCVNLVVGYIAAFVLVVESN